VTNERRKRMALVLVLFGAALRTWQYVARGSLWLDEAAIARNILARSYVELLQPLDYAQLAPKGFLFFSKFAVSVFGPNEHALRLYAFLLSLLSLPLFYRLGRQLLPQRAALLALALFAVLGRPIYYASEAKQYSGDIFFAILLLLFAVPVARGKTGARHAIRLGVAGAVAVWFSQPAIFVIAGIALGIALAAIRGRARVDRYFVVMLLLCAASAAPALGITIDALRPTDAAYMRSFWIDGFMPWPPRNAGDLAWPVRGLFGLFHDVLGMPVAALGVVISVFGGVVFWRRERSELFMLLGPIGAALGAGLLHLFPFTASLDGFNKLAAGNGRVLLFTLPSLVSFVVAGLEELIRSPSRTSRHVGRAIAALILGAPLYYALTGIPYTPQDLRPVVAAMVRGAQPGDRLYVYYGAHQAFRIYRPRIPFPDSAIVQGNCHRPAWREYLREIDALRGRGRLWVLVTHPAAINGMREGTVIEGYLDGIAPRLGKWGHKDAYVSLYDFRLLRPLRADAATWHPPPRTLPSDTVSLGFSCMGVFPVHLPVGPAGA
jgi:hypothetical protein